MTARRRAGAVLLAAAVFAAACGGTDEGGNGGDGGGGDASAGPGPAFDDVVRVRFVRGAPGTGGFFTALTLGTDLSELGQFDDELSPIDTATEFDEEGNPVGHTHHGFAELASLLRDQGFEVDEVVEPGGDDEAGVDLSAESLDDVDVLVLGSNNAVYTDDQVAAVVDWVRAGGALFVFQDVNYGSDWDDARDSDSQFLQPFGMRSTQDNGRTPTAGNELFVAVDHPILAGVGGFSSVGVAIIELTGEFADVSPEILIGVDPADDQFAVGIDRENTDESAQHRDADPASDAVLAVVEFGAGRVAAFWDRDFFFNDTVRNDNNALMVSQLFDWLAGPPRSGG